MIHFEPPPEPRDFEEKVRTPGTNWLRHHPTPKSEKLPDLWKGCRSELAEGFRCLCAYSVVKIGMRGQIDHYLSKANHRDLAYEWSSYRYASGGMNSRKGTCDEKILDPFEVQDGWFEVQLGTWQLLMTNKIPPSQRELAEFTLRQLCLGSSDDAVAERRYFYDLLAGGTFTLAALGENVPLVARAVTNVLEKLVPPPEEDSHYREFLAGDINITKLERDAPCIAATVRAQLPQCSAREVS